MTKISWVQSAKKQARQAAVAAALACGSAAWLGCAAEALDPSVGAEMASISITPEEVPSSDDGGVVIDQPIPNCRDGSGWCPVVEDCDDHANDDCRAGTDRGEDWWRLNFFCEGVGHAVNIVRAVCPPICAPGECYYCIADYGVIDPDSCWRQPCAVAPAKPTPPDFALRQLCDKYRGTGPVTCTVGDLGMPVLDEDDQTNLCRVRHGDDRVACEQCCREHAAYAFESCGPGPWPNGQTTEELRQQWIWDCRADCND